MRGLEAAVREVLNRRTRRSGPPIAVALSGGGDSLALMLMADAWARSRGRDLLTLTVDHGLRPESHEWTGRCAIVAERLGRPFQALTWDGDKPATGLPAAARSARHRLLADATRVAGARVILMGHTADDIAEAQAMRAAGSTTPDPREWAPSPAWPEGRGVFVLRPMLGLRRADLRAWLAARGEAWIEDPSNDDHRFARSRARATKPELIDFNDPSDAWGGPAHVEPSGLIRLARDQVTARRLGLACVCAGGGSRLPRGASLSRALGRLSGTLAGARIAMDGDAVLVAREPGEAARGGLAALDLPPGVETVWDGRFAITAERPGLVVRRLAGLARRLDATARRALAEIPALARGALPAVLTPDGSVGCPVLARVAGVACASLVADRFDAARGQVSREPA